MLLEARSLTVNFAAFVAVQDVSFALPTASLLGLIGPNGAGKTTLLRTLAGLQPALFGSVQLLGEPLTPGRRHLIGFTPDSPPVYEDLTVRRFLQFVGLAHKLDPDDVAERTEFWLEKVWLREKADVKLKTLSRGMRQRVGIARTLLPNPPVILLDEPAAGLDPAGRVQFRQLLVDLRDQGKTLIVSSHILSDMTDYCSHIGIMSAGKLVRFGTVAAIAGHHDETRRRYEVRITRPVAQLEQMLASLPGVGPMQIDRLKFVIEFGSDDDAAQDLLTRLIALGLPVCSFMPMQVNLEEAYLREGIRQVE
jgi:ABC-2 type transport system ATP-binding protein